MNLREFLVFKCKTTSNVISYDEYAHSNEKKDRITSHYYRRINFLQTKILILLNMTAKTPYQICVETLLDLGFKGEDTHFEKGDCHIQIIGEKIRLWYNVPGIDKEYIGPPLPSEEELKRFVKENTY